jgi:chromosomal replication initiation ATPase DnaA
MNHQEQVEHYKAVRARISGAAIKPKEKEEPMIVERRLEEGFRQKIIRECAEEFGISVKDILGNSRVNHIVMARRKAAWIFYQRGTMSYPQIGRLLNKNHSTIIHAVKKYQESLE